MFFIGGTFRSTVFFSAQNGGQSEYGGNGNDGSYDATIFPGYVREKRSTLGGIFEPVYSGEFCSP